jgi:hypothetical protein
MTVIPLNFMAIPKCHNVALAENDFFQTNPFVIYSSQKEAPPSSALSRRSPLGEAMV